MFCVLLGKINVFGFKPHVKKKKKKEFTGTHSANFKEVRFLF
jgi:hypothetical protein